jgi:zinc resistance-associated protein
MAYTKALAAHLFTVTIVIPIILATLIAGGVSGLALATTFAHAETPAGAIATRQAHTQNEDLLNSRMAYFKAVLKLTAAQERHWPPVESALRNIARQQVAYEASEREIVQRTGEYATEFTLSAAELRRLVSAAQPLVNSLNQEQKRDAIMLARAMGFSSVAEKFE